jgi:hypothetical protein
MRESYRRLSVDAGVAIGILGLVDLQQNATIAPDTLQEVEPEEVGINNSLTSLALNPEEMEIVHNPISLSKDALRSNIDGIASALPALALILASHLFVGYISSKGGAFEDRHGALCAVCMAMTELGIMIINSSNAGYARRRLLVGIPVNILSAALMSCFIFDWEPGWIWTPIILTISLWISIVATHPLHPEPRASFPIESAKNFVVAFACHGAIVAFIYSLVLPTRLLAENDNPVLTVVVTGLVFPALAFLTRKFTSSSLLKVVKAAPGLSSEERMKMFSRMTVGVSSQILFVPAVLLYFNKSLELALVSALTQLVTENAGKVVVIIAMKKSMKRKERAVENDPAALEELKKKHTRNLGILAVKWHNEMVAEKGCIICAALVAYLNFEDLVDATGAELVTIGMMFFCVEALTDVIFVHAMVEWFGVPMLSAIPKDSTFSYDHFSGSAMVANFFNAIAVCVAMAAMIGM